MDERTKTSFEFARDSTQQLITLATGIVALAITFSKDFVGNVNPLAKWIAITSWGALLLSVFFGLWTLLALTGSLGDSKDQSPTIRRPNVTTPSLLQIGAFALGIFLTIVFGITAT